LYSRFAVRTARESYPGAKASGFKEKHMKFVKILSLLAVAAAALMAFAGTASADTVTSPTGTTYTSTLSASSEGHAVLHNPIAKIECAGTAVGSVESHPAGGKVSGAVHPTFTGCTNSWHVTTIVGGTLSVEHSSGYNGNVYSDGATIESTRFGISCSYLTKTTKIGTVTGGTPATMHIEAEIPFHKGSGLCGTSATVWTGAYTVNTPGSLFVDNT
jgi:hypothetical protein